MTDLDQLVDAITAQLEKVNRAVDAVEEKLAEKDREIAFLRAQLAATSPLQYVDTIH